MFDNLIGAFSGILHPLWNWGAEAVNRPLPLLCMSYSGIVEHTSGDRSRVSSNFYQMAQRLAGAIGCPDLQANARWNSGRFTTTPLTRNSSGEWLSV